MTTPDWRLWIPDLAIGVLVASLGLFEAATAFAFPEARLSLVFVALVTAAAAGLSRRLPAAALALVWVVCACQLLWGNDLMLVQLAIAVVAFGTARWGSTTTLWVSGLSVPVAALIVVQIVNYRGRGGLAELAGNASVMSLVRELSGTWQITVAVIGMAALGAPWLAGLAFRLGDRARASRVSQVAAEQDAVRAVRETEQAREIARLREGQALLARDVHDVVGHSLAVILAQAESSQYLADSDTDALKTTMANIATAARSSLQDVRQVLSQTQLTATRSGGLESLIDGVRAGGHDVATSEVGMPQPLPPEFEVVAFRVLQEMLTNAIKHGRRGEQIQVERRWERELRITVHNVIGDDVAHAADGQGLNGMRRRLESAGGRLDVERHDEDAGPTFTATAWIPVRAGAR